MSCPYFFPRDPLAWPSAPILPLGEAYTGQCHADPERPADPGTPALRDLCNLGYVRGRCARFPQTDAPDAIRFCAVEHTGECLRISWSRERDHYPLEHGSLEYRIAAQNFASAPLDAIGMRQAEAYVASYLRRRSRQRRES